MKQRYNELTHELCVKATLDCLDHKWRRNDVLDTAEKYGGVPRKFILDELKENKIHCQLEAAESIACEIEQRILDVLDGYATSLDLDPITVELRADGVTGKIREIARCSVIHQIYGHLAVLALMPLFKAKILPCQFASIPGRGQTGIKRYIEKHMRKTSSNIRHTKKVDVHHAYGSMKYDVVIDRVKKDIPNATWIIVILESIKKIAIDGHLIIGGYIDAWLFNYMISYALRDIKQLEKTKRGKNIKLTRLCTSYMDDIGLGGPRERDLKSVVNHLDKWLQKNYGLHLKPGGKETHILSIYDERAMKRAGVRQRPSGLDMGGFIVHHSYTSVRRMIYKRVRRAYLRAKRDLEATGTVPIYRARRVICYYGYFKHTNSRHAREVLNVDKVMSISKKVVSYHSKRRTMKCAA